MFEMFQVVVAVATHVTPTAGPASAAYCRTPPAYTLYRLRSVTIVCRVADVAADHGWGLFVQADEHVNLLPGQAQFVGVMVSPAAVSSS